MATPAFLRRFPCNAALYDGEQVTIRPLQPNDKSELLSFFQRVPEEDRFYLNSDVAAPEVISEFTDRIDLSQTIPLVAEAEDRILADATLHRSRRAARRHVGELRVVVDPDYRGRGLGVRLIHELVQLGRDLELHALVFELVSGHQQSAIQSRSGSRIRGGRSPTGPSTGHTWQPPRPSYLGTGAGRRLGPGPLRHLAKSSDHPNRRASVSRIDVAVWLLQALWRQKNSAVIMDFLPLRFRYVNLCRV